jgi:hypothetical protein
MLTLQGQMSVFQITRHTALTLLNWDTIDADRLERLKKIIHNHTSTLLHLMVAERTAG